MTPDVIAELGRADQRLSDFHQQMLSEAQALIRMSRGKMSSRYADWDLMDEVYHGERRMDEEDITQAQKDKPVKMIVPNTFAQVMTFTSFLFLMFKQDDRLFTLGAGPGNRYGTAKEDCELLLDRDMRENEQCRLLFQMLLDTARFGLSITGVEWTRKISRIFAPNDNAVAGNFEGVTIENNPGSEWQDVVKYEGNLVRNVSPYHFFPDLRHPLSDFQKGEFCGCEEEYSMGDLAGLEEAGEVAGIDFIQPLPKDYDSTLGGAAGRYTFEVSDKRYNDLWDRTSSLFKTAPVIVTKMQRWIVPSKYLINGEPLGPETHKVLYHVWYANDNRLIRLEPTGWWHNEFGWSITQFTPDMQQTLNLGLADLVYRLQDIISWLYNSRIRDIRRNIFGRNVIDPRVVDTKTVDGDGDIYLRKGMSVPIERAFFPLPMNNVTQGHIGDADTLSNVMQVVTGVNDNMQGQVNKGRRSAREVGMAGAGASGRMKMHGMLIWESGPTRIARMCLSNLRQALEFDAFVAAVGEGEIDLATGQSNIGPRFKDFKGTPRQIAMGADYFPLDSTTGGEKGQLAASLQSLLEVILQSNPMAAAQFSQTVDPGMVMDEMMRLRGAGPIKRFTPPSLIQQLQRGGQPQRQGFGGVQ